MLDYYLINLSVFVFVFVFVFVSGYDKKSLFVFVFVFGGYFGIGATLVGARPVILPTKHPLHTNISCTSTIFLS